MGIFPGGIFLGGIFPRTGVLVHKSYALIPCALYSLRYYQILQKMKKVGPGASCLIKLIRTAIL